MCDAQHLRVNFTVFSAVPRKGPRSLTTSVCACDGRIAAKTDGGDEGEGDEVSGNSTVAAAVRAEAAPRRAAWLGLFACAAPLALLAMQALAARRLELTFDEAYYTLWSRSLSFGYLDHPPMVALLIRASTSLFGGAELGARALSLLIGRRDARAQSPSSPGALFGSGEKAALAALMWIAMPLVAIGAAFVTPDAPLVVFWTLGLAALVELWRTGEKRWLIALGLDARPGAAIEIHRRLFCRRRRARLGRDALAAPLARFARAVRRPRRGAHDFRPVRHLERRARLGDLRQAARPRAPEWI